MNKFMFRLHALCFLIFINVGLSNAQQLAGESPPILKVFPFFEVTYIKQFNIKEVVTEVMYKWPNQKLRNSFETQEFVFNRGGHLEKYRECGKEGTCFTKSYFLNKVGDLSTCHFKMGNRNELTTFKYDEDGLLLKIEKSNALDASLISEQNFVYEKYSEFQYKKFYLNDEGLTYKYEVVDLDQKNRVLESRSRFIHGVHRSSITVAYKNDLLTKHVTNTREITRREEKYLMEYDSQRKLQVAELWIDAALLYRYEYLYEDGLLDAILRKNLRTQEIQITKLEYSFFEL